MGAIINYLFLMERLKKYWWIPIILLCLSTAFIGRFLLTTEFGGPPHDGYLELARHLSTGQGYVLENQGNPVLHRPPAYVALLLGGMWLNQKNQAIYVILINTLCVLATSYIIKKSAGITAVFIFISNIWILWCIKNPMATIFQMFLYTLLIYLFLEKKSPWKIGVVAGILSLTHGTGLVVASILFAYKFFYEKQLKQATIATLLMLAIITPWTIRNYQVTGKIIPVASNMGNLYFAGNQYWNMPSPKIPELSYWGLKNYQEESQLNKAALEDLINNPLRFLKKITLNAINYYFPIIKEITKEKLLISIYYALLICLSTYCLIKKKEFHYALPIILSLLPYLPFLTFIGHSQYAFMSMPFFSIIIGRYFNEA